MYWCTLNSFQFTLNYLKITESISENHLSRQWSNLFLVHFFFFCRFNMWSFFFVFFLSWWKPSMRIFSTWPHQNKNHIREPETARPGREGRSHHQRAYGHCKTTSNQTSPIRKMDDRGCGWQFIPFSTPKFSASPLFLPVFYSFSSCKLFHVASATPSSPFVSRVVDFTLLCL